MFAIPFGEDVSVAASRHKGGVRGDPSAKAVAADGAASAAALPLRAGRGDRSSAPQALLPAPDPLAERERMCRAQQWAYHALSACASRKKRNRCRVRRAQCQLETTRRIASTAIFPIPRCPHHAAQLRFSVDGGDRSSYVSRLTASVMPPVRSGRTCMAKAEVIDSVDAIPAARSRAAADSWPPE